MTDTFKIKKGEMYVNRIGKLITIETAVKLLPLGGLTKDQEAMILFTDFCDNLYHENGKKFDITSYESGKVDHPEDLIYKLEAITLL